jgi:hypothetical protein
LNQAELRLTLRPRTVFEILDLATVILRMTFFSLLPLYLVIGVFWGAALAGAADIPEDRWLSRVVILLPFWLLLRFFLQMILVTFCGRWIFSGNGTVTIRSALADIREVGFVLMMVRGLVRFIKWISGFALLVPLWLVLIHRFFDYEHWLLERISGRELQYRLRNFYSSRVFAFRVLHACLQLLFVFLMSFALRLLFETAARMPQSEWVSVDLVMTLLLMYEPFFLISRFLLYIQTRIENEAWDIGMLFREGIRRTLSSKIALFLFIICAVPLRADEPDYLTAPAADRPCTDAMRKQPYVTCDPVEYRIYTADEIERSMPARKTQRSEWNGWWVSFFELSARAIAVAVIVLLLYFLWNQYRNWLPGAPPAGARRNVDKKEFEALPEVDRLSLVKEALQHRAYKAALGHCYLFLVEQNETAGSNMMALTPEELRKNPGSLYSGPDISIVEELIELYEQVFYAGADPSPASEVIERFLNAGVRK